MECARNRAGRTNWVSTLFHALLILSPSGLASAGLLDRRQNDGSNAASEAIAAASGATNKLAPTALSAIVTPTVPAETVATASPEITATAVTATTATSNGTVAANSTIPASAAATNGFSNPLNSTNDPDQCHVLPLSGGSGNPFCKPTAGETLLVGGDYEVTWDSSLFPSNSTNNISISTLSDNDGIDVSDKLVTLQEYKALNSEGSTFIHMYDKLLTNNSAANLTISLHNSASDGEPYNLQGPTILLTTNSTTTTSKTSSAPSSKSKKFGEEVGIPIGLVFLFVIIALIGAFLYIRRRRGVGYGAGKSRTQRIAAVTPGAASLSHRREASFHDEPTRGMELQDRSKGLTGEDNWDWGSPGSSPTTGGRNSNAFRDEIQRQKSGRRA